MHWPPSNRRQFHQFPLWARESIPPFGNANVQLGGQVQSPPVLENHQQVIQLLKDKLIFPTWAGASQPSVWSLSAYFASWACKLPAQLCLQACTYANPGCSQMLLETQLKTVTLGCKWPLGELTPPLLAGRNTGTFSCSAGDEAPETPLRNVLQVWTLTGGCPPIFSLGIYHK